MDVWKRSEMCRYVSVRVTVSKCVQTVVGGLGKAMAHGYAWVHVGACQCGWACVGVALVQCKRAVGAHGEGLGACIGDLGVARYDRSGAGLCGGGLEVV